MLVDINILFEMLDINNDISIQQKGIEEGKKSEISFSFHAANREQKCMGELC